MIMPQEVTDPVQDHITGRLCQTKGPACGGAVSLHCRALSSSTRAPAQSQLRGGERAQAVH